jgi:hypothetical protein
MPALTSLALGGLALAGGIAGAGGSEHHSSSGITLGATNATEAAADKQIDGSFAALQRGFGYGPGDSDIQASLSSQRNLAGMYQQASQNGGMPTSGDINTAQGFANDIFASQRMQLQQQFQDQSQTYGRQLAASGRGSTDPVFAAKMYDQLQRQQALLGSQQTGYGSQLALALPQQRLGLAAQGAQVQDALANQALQNRATLLGMGSQIQQSERNFRLATADKWGQDQSGGGFGGFLTGALGGATAGLNIAGGISALGKMGGAAAGAAWGGNATSGPNFMGPMQPSMPNYGANYGPQPQRYFGMGPVGNY